MTWSPRLPILLVCLLSSVRPASADEPSNSFNDIVLGGSIPRRWPAGTELLRFENLEGIVLLTGTLHGWADTDTTGPLALDTGAGYVALDLGLSRALGLADSAAVPQAVGLASRALPRLTLGGWQLDRVEPVLTVDGTILRRASDRPVLGLLGHKPLSDRAVWIDYREEVVAIIPRTPRDDVAQANVMKGLKAFSSGRMAGDSALARSRTLLGLALTAQAFAVPFEMVGDGKILVRGVVSDPTPPRFSDTLNLIVDTGSTKCVLFEEMLAPAIRNAHAWRALSGLVAPTLLGTASARIARVPAIVIHGAGGPLRVANVDVGIIRSGLAEVLARATGETIHGLIGYSLLRRFRVAVDYPNRVLWLDPLRDYRSDRPFEYCHVGLQLERRDGAIVVVAVVEDSPAAQAGILTGDEIVALDGDTARPLDLVALTRRMEGRPGRALTLVIRRDGADRALRLVRRRLL